QFNIVEALHMSDYFLLMDLKDIIIGIIKNGKYKKYCSGAALLSNFLEFEYYYDSEEHILDALIEDVARNPLYTIEFNQMNDRALRYFLTRTHTREVFFATPE